MQAKKTVTIRDVASHAGFSVAAVSKAMNGKKDISEECRSKIMESCRMLGYRLNANIQDFIRENNGSGNRNVAFLLIDRDFSDRAYGVMMSTVAQEVARRGYFLLFEKLTGKERDRYDLPPLLRDDRVSAVVISGDLNPVVMEAVRQLGLPCCVLGHYAESVVQGTIHGGHDYELLVESSLKMLREKGCDKIAIFVENPAKLFLQKITKAYEDRCGGELIYRGVGSYTGITDELRQALRSPRLPFDGLIALDSRVAAAAALELRSHFGYDEVPMWIATMNRHHEEIGVPVVTVIESVEVYSRALERLFERVMEKKDLFVTECIR